MNEKIEEKIEQLFIKSEQKLALITSITEIFSDFSSNDRIKHNTLHNLIEIMAEKIADSNSLAGSVLSDLTILNTERR